MSTISRDNVRVAAKLARDGKPNDLKIRFVDGEYRAKGGVRAKSVMGLYRAMKASEQSPRKVAEKPSILPAGGESDPVHAMSNKCGVHAKSVANPASDLVGKKLLPTGRMRSWIGDFIGDPVHTMSDASAKLSRTRKRRAARRGLTTNNGCFGRVANDQLTKRERRKLRLHSRRANAV